MAVSIGMVSGSSWVQNGVVNKGMGKNRVVVCGASSAARLTDQYKTLRLQPGASENEVKKSFRQLALQYHPDVCKGSNCGVQFSRINEAYDVVMSIIRESNAEEVYGYEYNVDEYDVEPMGGMYDESSSDMWEEWMGWEGAGIRDYSSHINPYA